MGKIESYQQGIALPGAPALPILAVRLGKRGLIRFLEFFTVNIRNRNRREAYGRAAGAFLRWCEDREPRANHDRGRSRRPPVWAQEARWQSFCVTQRHIELPSAR